MTDFDDHLARTLAQIDADGLMKRERALTSPQSAHITVAGREMLRLHRDFSSRYPELKGHSLYRRVVARRLDGNDLVAEAVLHHATQSFAIWPVERELNFRDVVHYLAVSQYVALHPGTRWVHADIKRLVEELIPAQL